MHDAGKLLLGVTGSSDKEITCYPADPASFPAGTAVRAKSDEGLLIAANGTAALCGVSLGASQSDTKKTAVARVGEEVPLLVTDVRAVVTLGDLTFTAYPFGDAGNGITVTLADELVDGGAEIATDPDSPTDVIVNIEDGVTTAQAIADAINAHPPTLLQISVAIADGEEETAQDADDATLADGDDVLVVGGAVTVDDTTGLGAASGTATSAVYLSGLLRGQTIDGTEYPAAYIAFPGGL